MRGRLSTRLGAASECVLILALAVAPGITASAADTLAANPSDLSITVYRAPDRTSGSIALDALRGFALVSETRVVHLPAGISRLRFEGVADGIEPASAIVTGLPDGVIEKNREGALLSPSAVLAAALDRPVTLLRTEKGTGKLSRVAGSIRSDVGGGVVFETAEGIEALRCSGLAETFSFAGVADLANTPTLSVQVHSDEPVTRTVTLSYLARGFDWAADYRATLSADAKTLELGAWVTLANGNGVGFPGARAQLVAGSVNRENGEVEPLDLGGPILAQCWPQGTTSDQPNILQVDLASPLGSAGASDFATTQTSRAFAPMAMQNITLAAARKVEEEQLGDLKLYRVPGRTTVASRQSKQVRLLDRAGIPVTLIYGADVAVGETRAPAPASRLLRTMNTRANHLGLPLPSGHIVVFAARMGERLLLSESAMRDLAVDEELEINLGDAPDVQVAAAQIDHVNRVDISNAGATDLRFELRLRLPEGKRVVHADHSMGTKNGRPIFRLTLRADETVTLRYQTEASPGNSRH
jgi:hypothetical protein